MNYERSIHDSVKSRFSYWIQALVKEYQAVTSVGYETISGLLKLLYPDGNCSDDELEELLLISCELRQRVRDQLHLMAPGEYERIKISAKILSTGNTAIPNLPDSEREQHVNLPEVPSVGEVVGLAVAGDRGCILKFEMQATKGTGRIVPLGSIQE